VHLNIDIERRLAIAELLAQPDPPELRRAHHLRVEGKPERYAMLPLLSAVFVQRKLIALEERREATVATERHSIVWTPRKALRRVLLPA
jgi:hypothetical protein